MRRITMFGRSAIAAALFTSTTVAGVVAQDGDAFYEGKTLSIVVGYKPGGGFDAYARMLAPHLEEELGATVIVENMPGGGGLSALNDLVRGEADGLSIMLVNGVPAALGQIVDTAAVRYDLADITYLGRVAGEPWVVLASKASGFETLQDLIDAGKERTITFSGIGRTDGPTDTASVMCAALEISCKMVIGFGGSSETALAAMRGEVDAFAVSDRGGVTYGDDENLTPLATLARDRSEKLPDVPTIFEEAELTDDQAYWIDFREGVNAIGRSFVAHPETPQDRVESLRVALEAVLTDPAVQEEGESKDLPIDYRSGPEVEAIVDDIFSSTPEAKMDEVRDVLVQRYF